MKSRVLARLSDSHLVFVVSFLKLKSEEDCACGDFEEERGGLPDVD